MNFLHPVFQVPLISENNQQKEIIVEVYSSGADGLFVRMNGKTVDRIVVIETDSKFTSKRYLAGWDQGPQRFRFVLQHRVWGDQSSLKATRWEMFLDGNKFTASEPKVTVFPKAESQRHTLHVKTIFAENPGGITNLPALLYPLPITPYRSEERSGAIRYFHDDLSGVRRVAVKFSITSRIPTEHILAYI